MPKILYVHMFHALKCVRPALAVVSHTSCQMAVFSDASIKKA